MKIKRTEYVSWQQSFCSFSSNVQYIRNCQGSEMASGVSLFNLILFQKVHLLLLPIILFQVLIVLNNPTAAIASIPESVELMKGKVIRVFIADVYIFNYYFAHSYLNLTFKNHIRSISVPTFVYDYAATKWRYRVWWDIIRIH